MLMTQHDGNIESIEILIDLKWRFVRSGSIYRVTQRGLEWTIKWANKMKRFCRMASLRKVWWMSSLICMTILVRGRKVPVGCTHTTSSTQQFFGKMNGKYFFLFISQLHLNRRQWCRAPPLSKQNQSKLKLKLNFFFWF